MAWYTVRVELRGNPSYEEYDKLHSLMALNGWSKSLTGVTAQGQSLTRDLPHATYYGESLQHVGSVRDSLQTLVHTNVQPNFIIFVAETTNWAIG